MKSLLFEKLELLSMTEKQARTIEFHPRLTVITGGNGVGKSSIIKSIYWTLGAAPAAVHRRWANANVKSRLTFTVDGVQYRALRSHDTIAVFDSENRRLISTNAITSELGPFLAKMLDFGLVFTNREGEPETPPPAYAFLPFYVDQDGGWEKPLNSFDRLTQYSAFKRPLIEFHSGIKPNRHYELTAEKKRVELERAGHAAERTVVQRAIERLGPTRLFSGIELSEAEHDSSVDQLLVKLKSLHDARQKRALELADIVDKRTNLESEIAIVKAAAGELAKDADFAFADERSEIPCPICGVLHANDFTSRFAILADREQCFDFILKGQALIDELVGRAVQAQADIDQSKLLESQIQEVLDRRSGELTLRQVIESQGRTAARTLFDDQTADLDNAIGKCTGKISELEAELSELKNPRLKREIEQFYASLMQSYIRELNVLDPDADAISKIAGRVMDTGSEHPRLLLSYQLALLNTIHRYSSAFTGPFVIDSPNQQDQDSRNAAAMISLIISSRPENGQTILGTVSLHDNEVRDGKIVVINERQSALVDEEFEEVYRALLPSILAI